ncbi:MAG TPA: thiamine ABC transporter substrate-binding protein [Anaerolineales bacterium]|nr:thiamine ABC transporter substrate-binding protein [Anaerolineales bacterium]
MKKLTLFLSTFLFLFAACSPQATETQSTGPQTITVMTHDSFSISEGVVESFEAANNATVVFLQSGDAGAVLNRAILTKDAPLADVLFGVDNTFLSRALEGDIFETYESPALGEIPDEFKLDSSNRALPVDYGDVCINYDKAYFVDNNLAVPQSLEDLTKPEYEGLLVTENPATSSTGLAFLLATVAHFGDSFTEYWQRLKDNGVVIVDGWETAYYTNFSGSSGRGPQPLVVSYGTSPAAEVIFAETPPADAPTASILGPDTCFRQFEFVGILKGTKQRALAEKFVDFMLSKQFQEDVPLQMFVYPVLPGAALPEEFTQYAQAPAQAATLPPEEIAANRDTWIQAWTDVVLK